MTEAAGVLVLFALLMALGAPIAFALGLAGVVGFASSGGLDILIQVPFLAYQAVDNSALMAVPLFIVMGTILLHGKIGEELFELAAAFVGHRRGGLAVATILACALFSSISASSLATAATIGAMSVPNMLRHGYPRELVFGPVAAGGTLGILIPPSTTLILYGAMTNVSVGDLFIAGIVPGGVLTAMLAGMAVILAGRATAPRRPASTAERMAALRKGQWGLLLPVLVLGGLYVGVFTPNEAGAMGVVLSLVVTLLVKRSIPLARLPGVLMEATRTAGFLFAVIVGASLFNHLMTEMMVMQRLTEFVVGLAITPTLVLIVISGLLLLLGMFFEVASIVLVMIPILFPLVNALGIDPVWFGIFFVVNIEMAYITPPVGMNLFIIQEISRHYCVATFWDVQKSTLPYMCCLLAMLVVLIAYPRLATILL